MRVSARLVDIVVVLLLFSVVLTACAYQAFGYRGVGSLDEAAHFDYILKLLRNPFSLPPVGSREEAFTALEVSCRGQIPGFDCVNVAPVDAVAPRGVNYVLMYAPVFYYPAALVSAVLHHTVGVSYWNGARLASGLFLALGAAAFYAGLRRLRAPIAAAIGGACVAVAIPWMLFLGSTINPDSLAPLAAGVALWIFGSRLRGRWAMVAVTAVAAVIGLVKPNFVPFASVVVLCAGLVRLSDSGTASVSLRTWIRARTGVVVLAMVPLGVQLAWNGWRMMSLVPGQLPDGGLNTTLMGTSMSLPAAIVQAAGTLLDPISRDAMPDSGLQRLLGLITQTVAFGWVAVASARGAASFGARDSLIARGAGLGILATIVYIPTVLYISYHSIGTQHRYIFPLLLLAIAGATLSCGRIVARWVCFAFGIGMLIVALGAILATYG
ncbi:MAG: hypothetical protein CMH36_09075 [Microbacterium sp.]|uniref:Glycosyltransferase RgtA/B/C/D-like domain-containing protein n=1 Tax=Microbacterium ginsengisoli TaxID=400772 RepID=A0A0F0LSC4_9MICO|nr:hypothetical protein RR49_02363 [Microbacterium ginsengisoli]MAL06963.1 hypothetical protein [Microbacterium sp.]HAN26032.1 hypothetical protein [Microbacterium ginsengisoli]